jgi:hypothetical protein
LLEAIIEADTRAKCDNCGGRGADFAHNGHDFCAECMSALISWLLDGGITEDPEIFAWVYIEEPADPSPT